MGFLYTSPILNYYTEYAGEKKKEKNILKTPKWLSDIYPCYILWFTKYILAFDLSKAHHFT